MAKKRNLPLGLEDEKAENGSLEDIRLTKRAHELIEKEPEVKERYEAFKEAKIAPKRLEKFLLNKYDITISEDSATMIATMVKIFAGEITERAREIMTERKKGGEIQSKFIRMAYLDVRRKFKGPLFKDEESFN